MKLPNLAHFWNASSFYIFNSQHLPASNFKLKHLEGADRQILTVKFWLQDWERGDVTMDFWITDMNDEDGEVTITTMKGKSG